MREIEVLLRGGTIYDGSGGPAFLGDIAISSGKILAVGNLAGASATRIIDIEGMACSPGFIDIHSHTDEAILVNPRAESKVRQGVTTELCGNCGGSPAPLAGEFLAEFKKQVKSDYDLRVRWRTLEEYLLEVEKRGTAINYALLVGNGNLRGAVKGFRRGGASKEELEKMRDLLQKSIREGAWGLSSGLIYIPSSLADKEELTYLATVLAGERCIYATHIRGEGQSLFPAIREALDVALGSGVSLEISHLKASGEKNWGRADEIIAMLEEARANGSKVDGDIYPYAASSTGLDAIFPEWCLEGGKDAFLSKLRDPIKREKIESEMVARPLLGWDRIVVSSVRTQRNRDLEGKNIEEIAAARALRPEHVVIDLFLEEGSVSAIYFGMHEKDVRAFTRLPYVSFGSDATARSPYGTLGRGKPHPRAYGTFPRVLGHYVREEKVLAMEEALRKMTSHPAIKIGLRDRGMLAEGMWADVVVFDPAKIRDEATFLDPHRYPRGIRYVLVNGKIVVEEGEHTGALPGKVLRRPA